MSLGDRHGGHRGDTALVALVPDHAHVAGLTPLNAPADPEDPVVRATLSAIADNVTSAAEADRRARRLVIDATGVALEGPKRSIETNADWAILSALVGEFILIALADLDVAPDRANGLGSREPAAVLGGLVRVVRLEVEPATLLGDDVVEGRGHLTTVAPIANEVINAVDEVGLRVSLELARGKEVRALSRGDGRESPAAAALALVLDVVDGTLQTPVERVGALEVALDSLVLPDMRLETEERLVLARGQGGELVKGNLEGSLGVVLLNKTGVGEVDTKAELVLVTAVELVVVPHPGNEGFLLVSMVQSRTRERNESKHSR